MRTNFDKEKCGARKTDPENTIIIIIWEARQPTFKSSQMMPSFNQGKEPQVYMLPAIFVSLVVGEGGRADYRLLTELQKGRTLSGKEGKGKNINKREDKWAL